MQTSAMLLIALSCAGCAGGNVESSDNDASLEGPESAGEGGATGTNSGGVTAAATTASADSDDTGGGSGITVSASATDPSSGPDESDEETANSTGEPPEGDVIPNSVDIIINDMGLASDCPPQQGVEGEQIVQQSGLHPTLDPAPDVQRVGGWGMIAQCHPSSGSSNVGVEVRNFQVYILRESTGAWESIVQSDLITDRGGPDGAENCIPVDIICRKDCTLGPDVQTPTYDCPLSNTWVTDNNTIGAQIDDQMFYQPWGFGGFDAPPADVAAVWTSYEARLITLDPAGPDERDAAQFAALAGADWYSGSGPHAGGAGVARWKYLRSQWQTFNMVPLTNATYTNGQEQHALTPMQLTANPPPL